MSRFFFLSSLGGKGFSDRRRDGECVLRTSQTAAGVSNPAKISLDECPSCHGKTILTYRCSNVSCFDHEHGIHVECQACGFRSVVKDGT